MCRFTICTDINLKDHRNTPLHELAYVEHRMHTVAAQQTRQRTANEQHLFTELVHWGSFGKTRVRHVPMYVMHYFNTFASYSQCHYI